jgi:hypothetical protein
MTSRMRRGVCVLGEARKSRVQRLCVLEVLRCRAPRPLLPRSRLDLNGCNGFTPLTPLDIVAHEVTHGITE